MTSSTRSNGPEYSGASVNHPSRRLAYAPARDIPVCEPKTNEATISHATEPTSANPPFSASRATSHLVRNQDRPSERMPCRTCAKRKGQGRGDESGEGQGEHREEAKP